MRTPSLEDSRYGGYSNSGPTFAKHQMVPSKTPNEKDLENNMFHSGSQVFESSEQIRTNLPNQSNQ